MREAIHEEKYKGDLTIKIYQDEDARSPQEDGDTGLFLVGYHRDFSVDAPIVKGQILFTQDNLQAHFEDAKGSMKDSIFAEYHIFGLEAYIHSGVRLALANEGRFPDRQWDVSLLGAVFASKKEWRMRKSARKAVLGLIESWNDYLDGNVYGFVVEGPDGEHLDSCWGFSGDYDAEYGALSEGRSQAEYHYKEILKKKAQKTKAYIKNHVPLQYRTA